MPSWYKMTLWKIANNMAFEFCVAWSDPFYRGRTELIERRWRAQYLTQRVRGKTRFKLSNSDSIWYENDRDLWRAVQYVSVSRYECLQYCKNHFPQAVSNQINTFEYSGRKLQKMSIWTCSTFKKIYNAKFRSTGDSPLTGPRSPESAGGLNAGWLRVYFRLSGTYPAPRVPLTVCCDYCSHIYMHGHCLPFKPFTFSLPF